MTRSTFTLVIVTVVLALPISVEAATIFSDDFEGYADDAQFKAVWNGAPDPAPSLAVGGGRNGGNGVVSSGGAVVQRPIIPPLPLRETIIIVAEADYWDYSTGSGDRNTLGLRGTGAIFEIGEYNSMDPDTSVTGNTGVQGYGFRTVFVGGPAELAGWVMVVPATHRMTSTDPAVGYHHFKMEIGSTFCRASVQLSNGAVYSKTVTLTSTAGDTLDTIRIGGPSGVSSTGTGIWDNIEIYTTPEPATMLLIGLGGLLLRRRAAA